MMNRRIGTWVAIGLAVAFVAFRIVLGAFEPRPEGIVVTLWHKYGDAERMALERAVARFNEHHKGRLTVQMLAVPHDGFQDKLRLNANVGQGPDVFILEHNPLGKLVQLDAVAPIDPGDVDYLPGMLDGLTVDGKVYGLPLNYKGLFVFRNKVLCPEPIASEAELYALQSTLPAGAYTLVYPPADFFFHAALFTAFDGRIFGDDGHTFVPFDAGAAESFTVPGKWQRDGIIAAGLDYNQAQTLFNSGRAALWINGPWAVGAVGLPSEQWTADELFAVNGRKMGSMVTVEAAMISPFSEHPELAEELARFLAGPEAAQIRLDVAGLAPVFAHRYDADAEPLPRVCQVQRAALANGFVTPNQPRMGLVWEVAKQLLERATRGEDFAVALNDAKRELARRDKKPPDAVAPDAYIAILGVGLLFVAGWLVVWSASRENRRQFIRGRTAYTYLLPGMLAILVLTVAPLVVGAGLAFFAHVGGSWYFVGVQNFVDIIGSQDFGITEPRNFFFTLGVTTFWTITNVILHVLIGVILALFLRHQWMRMRGVYRVLLILPWAIPNYITALMWKGMFNTQFGAINGLLISLGAMDPAKPMDWFSQFATAFTANLCTNTWLGFPFMMVVTLGALQNVPSELEEAATLDGASRWQKFRLIVWPHLKPALLPAVILGTIWTFNMFNVIYLVSAGAPNGSTEILVTEAYRWAFEGEMRQGYAAAYATLIFFILLAYSGATGWLMRARKPAPPPPTTAAATPPATAAGTTSG